MEEMNKKKSNPFKNKGKANPFQNKKKTKPNEDEEIEKVRAGYDSIDPQQIKEFSDFPLSWKTLKGLKAGNYKIPTDIQRESIGFALKGRDILGAAITGSGKTLAFLIPILENLFLKKWTRMDGVGAIIISPTRELAYQIFEALKKIGAFHDFSGGLIIGGKNLKFERHRMDQCNIIICTPGRLLQHMDENPLFDASSMQILVLDEADRCLDMGFSQTMNGIIENLPSERQTLLFSATQTKSVKDLARLSLVDPVYVAPHEQQMTTPEALQQNYVVVELEDKLTMIWSFIKNHLKQKSIIFLSSCKQVKYFYEIFCKLRPGISLLALYGTLHQERRIAIYSEFCRKNHVVLFATDIASRGLDFPIVNWVIQLDCPEDVNQYIHRAGRTARHTAKGESLLVLLPSEEEAMLEELASKKISINKIHIDPKRLFSPRVKIEAFLAQNKELKESAQRAFVAYIKSVVLMKNKKIFDVEELDFDAFSRSLGLVVTPRVRFLERMKKRKALKEGESSKKKTDGEGKSESEEDKNEDKTTDAKDKKRKNDFTFNNMMSDDSDNSDEEDFLKVKRRDHEIEEELKMNEGEESLSEMDGTGKNKIVTKAAVAKRVLKKKIIPNKKITFDEEGEEVVPAHKQVQSELAREYMNKDDGGGIDIETAKKVLREEDKFDKKRFRELTKAKHKEQKKKLKQKEMGEEMDEFGSDEDDGNDVDLSWLPDPDNIYNVKNSDSESETDEDDNEIEERSDSEEDSGSEELETIHKPPKKLYEKNKSETKKRSAPSYNSGAESEEEKIPSVKKKAKKITEKLTVDEAEMLAMELLGKS